MILSQAALSDLVPRAELVAARSRAEEAEECLRDHEERQRAATEALKEQLAVLQRDNNQLMAKLQVRPPCGPWPALGAVKARAAGHGAAFGTVRCESRGAGGGGGAVQGGGGAPQVSRLDEGAGRDGPGDIRDGDIAERTPRSDDNLPF